MIWILVWAESSSFPYFVQLTLVVLEQVHKSFEVLAFEMALLLLIGPGSCEIVVEGVFGELEIDFTLLRVVVFEEHVCALEMLFQLFEFEFRLDELFSKFLILVAFAQAFTLGPGHFGFSLLERSTAILKANPNKGVIDGDLTSSANSNVALSRPFWNISKYICCCKVSFSSSSAFIKDQGLSCELIENSSLVKGV